MQVLSSWKSNTIKGGEGTTQGDNNKMYASWDKEKNCGEQGDNRVSVGEVKVSNGKWERP